MGSKVILLCLVLIFSVSIVSAESEKPIATFNADVTEGYAPLHVHFTSETTGDPTSYFWTFEPQTSSDWNSHHPVTAGHTFQNPGVYDISLVVTNSAGSYTVKEPNYITVLAPTTPTSTDTSTPAPAQKPTATFSADVTEGYAPLGVHFTSETTGDPTSYFWTFEPQTSSDWNSHHPVTAGHTFQNPGVYDISLVVTNSAGSYTVKEPNYITVLAPTTPTSTDTATPAPAQKPTATFSADVTSGKVPLSVTFADTSTGGVPTSRYWNFGDGTNSAGGPTVTHTFVNPGTYTVALTVTNEAGSDTKCKNNYITVSEVTKKPTASFTADITSGEVPLSVTLTDTSIGSVPTSRYWNFGDGTNSAGGPTVTHTFVNPGTYTVALTVTNEAGSDTKSKNNYVTVSEAPTSQPVQSITSQPAPSLTDQPGPSTPSPTDLNIILYCTKTVVSVGEDTQSTLSVANLIDKPIVHAQVILMPPSGTSVTSSEFVKSSGGQCEATYDINPGDSKNIGVNIKANQVGNFNVKGRVHYYFGDNRKDAEDYPLDLPIQASDPQPTPTSGPEPPNIPDLGAASLVFILMTAVILKRKEK